MPRFLALGVLTLLLGGCATIDGLLGTCTPPSDTESFAFDVTWTRVVQGNQTATNLAPVLAGRPAGIEILLTLVDGALRPHLFDVRATVDVTVDGEPAGSLDLELGCVRGERSAMRGTIPGTWIRQGTEVEVTLRSASPNVAIPTDPIVVEPIVAEVPVLEVTVVPLVVGGAFPDPSREVYASWLESAQQHFAVAAYDLEVLPPLDLGLGDTCEVAAKFPALQELWNYRTVVDSDRFFVGVMPCSVGGVALMPGFAQVTSPGVAAVETFLHELGHNLSLAHAPCGEPLGVDPGFPYQGGVLGLPGYDVANDAWIPATAFDVMGYCSGSWLSDYHYARSARYRVFQERPPVLEALDVAPLPISLVVQGEVRPDGTVRVTHAQRLRAPSAPRAAVPGDADDAVRIEVIGRAGEVLTILETHLIEIDHVASRVFSTRIGVTEATGFAAESIRVVYDGSRASHALVDLD